MNVTRTLSRVNNKKKQKQKDRIAWVPANIAP